MKNFFIALSVFFLSCSSNNNPTSPKDLENQLLGSWDFEELKIIELETNKPLFRFTKNADYAFDGVWVMIDNGRSDSAKLIFLSNFSGFSVYNGGKAKSFNWSWSVSGTSLNIYWNDYENDYDDPIEFSFTISNENLILKAEALDFRHWYDNSGNDVILQLTFSPLT